VEAAIKAAMREEKIPLHLQATRSDAGIHVQLQAGEGVKRGAQVYLAVAEDEVTSKVSAGENSGHMLVHAGVVRSLTKVGKFTGDGRLTAELKISARWGKHLRLVAVLAERDGGKIVGAAAAEL
jgi:hypothetical protein